MVLSPNILTEYSTSVRNIAICAARLVLWSKNWTSYVTYVYWTVHHLDSWVKRDQFDVTCFISLLNAQHVSDVNTAILRSLRLMCWVITWVALIWFDVCWCYVVVWLWWCGIRMQVEALPQWSGSICVGVTLWYGCGGVVYVCRLKHYCSNASTCIRIPHHHSHTTT